MAGFAVVRAPVGNAWFADDGGVAGVDQLAGDEDGHVVLRPEGGKLFEDAEEFGRDLREAYLGVDLDLGNYLLGADAGAHQLLEAVEEGAHVLLAEADAGGALVSAEVFQQVGALLEGFVHVELLQRACRAGDEAVGSLGEDDGGLVVGFHDAAGHDAHHAAVPPRVVEHQRLAAAIEGVVVDAALGLLGGAGVEVFAFEVVGVDVVGQLARDGGVVGEHQPDAVEGRADAPGGVDAWPYEEHQVADGELLLEVSVFGLLALVGIALVGFSPVHVAVFEDGLDAGAGFGVEHAQSEEGQHAVLAHDGDDVAGDGDGYQVEVFQQAQLEFFLPLAAALVELLGHVAQAHTQALLQVGFDDLEAYAAAAEFFVGVGAVGLFGVEHGHRPRHLVAGQVVVADDEVDAVAGGVVHLFHGFDAAVEGYHQLHTGLARVVDALVADAVAFAFAVGDVEVYVAVELLKVGVHQRHCRRAVDVVVAVDHDALFLLYGLVDALYRLRHALHEEGVVNLVEPRTEEPAGLLERRNAPFYQQGGDDSVNAK